MKIVRILLFVFIFLVKSFAQETDFTQCNGTLTIEGEEIALEGGKFKPSSNAPGEYFRALVVYVQFVPDDNLVSD